MNQNSKEKGSFSIENRNGDLRNQQAQTANSRTGDLVSTENERQGAQSLREIAV